MHRAMRKTQDLPFKCFAAQQMEINNCLPLFPGLVDAKNISPEELNEILLHIIPNSWVNKYYLQVWDFKGKTYKETWEIFEHMEIVEQV